MAVRTGYSGATEPGGGRNGSKWYTIDAEEHAVAINAATTALAAIGSAASSPLVAIYSGENYSSSTYGDCTTITDTVTVTVPTSGKVLVFLQGGGAYVSGSGGSPVIAVALSGANTVAASDTNSMGVPNTSGAGLFVMSGLSSGSTTFKMKYKSSAGTATFAFFSRRITVIPLP